MKQLIIINEAAKHFKISRRTFPTLINNTPVKYYQVGRQKRFDLSELERSFEKISVGKVE